MDIFKLFGKIAIEDDEAHEKLGGIRDKASAVAEKVGNVASVVGKATLAAVGAASTAIVGLAKTSLDAYADYEQLVGGVETLFGAGGKSLAEYAVSVGKTCKEASEEYDKMINTQNTVLKNSQQAYKTAGLSANEYMETVTSFSASLLQSLGGDTEKAASYADRAIVDMSDNANKMGTSMEMIQNAYNGFAKQNYTMLDNLKLGYGGTQEEMKRLIADAAKMTDVQEKLGITVDASSMSFGNIVNAISVMQEEIGIAGTTAEEAATTISGSIGMTKSAWQNLLVGFADSSQDMDSLIDNLVNSVTTAAHNIVPRLAQIFAGISKALEQIIPVIVAELPALIEQLLPGVISGAVALTTGLIKALPMILDMLIAQLPFIISEISAALVEVFPVLLDTVKGLFGQIWDYIAINLLGTEADFESSFTKVKEFFEDLWVKAQEIWDSVGQPIWDIIMSCVDTVKGVFAEKMPEIKEFVSGCFSDIQSFWENNLKPCFDAIGNFIEKVLAPVFDFVFSVLIGGAVQNAFDYIKDIWNNTLKPVFTGITDFLTGVFTLDFDKAIGGLSKIWSGLWNGILATVEKPINDVKNFINEAIDYLKEKFNFDWSLPKIKLPHFRITGEFSLSPPSIPKLSVDWYKKAYDEALVLSDPTIFGYAGESGDLLGGGDGNGNEVVAGEAHLLNLIGNVVDSKTAAQNERIISVLVSILDAILGGNEEMLQALLTDRTFTVGEREFARLVKQYA